MRKRIVPVRDGYETLWTELLESLSDSGAITLPSSVSMTRLILMGAMNQTIEWFDPSGNQSVDQLAEAIARQLWDGVTPR